MRLLRRVGLVAASLTLVFGGQVAMAPPAQAGTGLYYHVIDADTDPYSGIYLRNDPNDFNNATRITSRYVLYGTSVELVCGTWGQAIGPYANRRWHQIYVPSGYAAGQTGWMPDRYMDTPNAANQYTPGEPECVAPTYNGSVYFSSTDYEGSPATAHRAYNLWTSSTRCVPGAGANDFPSWVSWQNKYIKTASGFSIGRLGPVYMLEQAQGNPGGGRWQEITYILLFDPGNYDDLFVDSCDTSNNRGQLFTKWLNANPNAHLVILAGARTAEGGHKGIQKLYFDYLRSNGVQGARDRVLVCNYDGMGHRAVYDNYKDAMNNPPPAGPLTAAICPGTESWAWHP